MHDEWKIKTGTLYFHLKEMKGLITQDDDKLYILTSDGKKLCGWFLGNQEGQAKVTKIDAFSRVARPIYVRLEKSIFLQIILILFSLSGLIGSVFVNTLLLGPMPLPRPADLGFEWALFINFVTVIIQFVILLILSNVFGKSNWKSVVKTLLFSNSLNYLFVSLLLLVFVLPLPLLPSFTLGVVFWFVISTISQAFFIMVITGSLMIGHGIKPERSLLISFVMLYVSLSLGLIFGFF